MTDPFRMPMVHAQARGLVSQGFMTPNFAPGFDYAIVPLSELAHIETFTDPKGLDRLRAQWEPARLDPIELFDGDTGRYVLRDGNHRLRLARERGDETIAAIVRRREE